MLRKAGRVSSTTLKLIMGAPQGCFRTLSPGFLRCDRKAREDRAAGGCSFPSASGQAVQLMLKAATFMRGLSIAVGDFCDPEGQTVEHFIQRLPVRASGPRQDMEGMIRALDRLKNGAGAQTLNHWKQ